MREPLELLDAAGGGHQHPRRQQLRRRAHRLVPHAAATPSYPLPPDRRAGGRRSGLRRPRRSSATPGEVTTRCAAGRPGSCPRRCQAKWGSAAVSRAANRSARLVGRQWRGPVPRRTESRATAVDCTARGGGCRGKVGEERCATRGGGGGGRGRIRRRERTTRFARGRGLALAASSPLTRGGGWRTDGLAPGGSSRRQQLAKRQGSTACWLLSASARARVSSSTLSIQAVGRWRSRPAGPCHPSIHACLWIGVVTISTARHRAGMLGGHRAGNVGLIRVRV